MSKKIKRIGFDLDGVVIDKPPIIPKWFVEYIYRGKQPKNELHYRYPKHSFEIFLRQFSHHPLLRPPIKQQIDTIKELHESKKYKMYAITSRYSFLEKRTKQWFKYYDMNRFFEKIFINIKDEQPHEFKQKVIEKLNIDLFIDDDKLLLEYLKKNNKQSEFIFVDDTPGDLKKLLEK